MLHLSPRSNILRRRNLFESTEQLKCTVVVEQIISTLFLDLVWIHKMLVLILSNDSFLSGQIFTTTFGTFRFGGKEKIK